MTDIKNKTAFVTGAASGIGLALSKALLARGAKVMMADIDAEGLNAAQARQHIVDRHTANLADYDACLSDLGKA